MYALQDLVWFAAFDALALVEHMSLTFTGRGSPAESCAPVTQVEHPALRLAELWVTSGQRFVHRQNMSGSMCTATAKECGLYTPDECVSDVSGKSARGNVVSVDSVLPTLFGRHATVSDWPGGH